jgi:hypothetical protein
VLEHVGSLSLSGVLGVGGQPVVSFADIAATIG